MSGGPLLGHDVGAAGGCCGRSGSVYPCPAHHQVLEGVGEIGRQPRQFLRLQLFGLFLLCHDLDVAAVLDNLTGALDTANHFGAVLCIDAEKWQGRVALGHKLQHKIIFGVLVYVGLAARHQYHGPACAVALCVALDRLLDFTGFILLLALAAITGAVVEKVQRLALVRAEERKELVGQLSQRLRRYDI